MSIGLKFTIDGKEVPLDRAADAMEKAIKADVSKQVVAKLSQVRCPVHGETPKNIRMTSEGSQMNWKFEACCNRLEEEAGKQLS
jgi:hypothetical protein